MFGMRRGFEGIVKSSGEAGISTIKGSGVAGVGVGEGGLLGGDGM